MPTSVFITRQIPDAGIKLLKEKGYDVDVNPKNRALTQKELIKCLKRKPYDAVISLLTDTLDAKLFDAVPGVKCYANFATGFDNIDLAAAKARGIAVSNAPAVASSEAVAEHAIALSLALAARIVEADDYMRRGKYDGWDPMLFIGTDVLGKTLGIIGAGRIGSRVAHYAVGLGLSVIYFDMNRNPAIEQEGATYCASIEDVLQKADIVTLHVPLLESTRHLMTIARLRMMKRGSMLVNTSRGPVIDEKALVEVLTENRKTGKGLAGAALDVFEFEPKLTPGLRKLPNVILTPHIASASVAARDEMATIAANNIIDFIEGRPLRNAVAA